MNGAKTTADDDRRALLALFEQSPGFVCFLRGPEFEFELANKAYFQLVGHRDILGKRVREAIPEGEGQGFFEQLQRVYATGEPYAGRGERVSVQRVPGGPREEVFVDFVYQPIRGSDGRVSGILAQGHDVTEVKRAEAQRHVAEAALRASEARYRALFDSLDDGYCLMQMLVDRQGEYVDYRFLETNSAFELHTGLRDAVGKTALELVPNLDGFWVRRYGEIAKTGQSARFESPAPAMGGRWFDVHASRVGEPREQLVALVFKDVTEQRRAVAEKEQLLTRESDARQEAEEASRLKDEFLATVSHELRTPLTSILGWVQLLRGGNLPVERHERALATVERNARAQAQLIEDLLDVSRILAGKLRLDTAVVDVSALVLQALESVRPAAEAKLIQVATTIDTEVPVLGDAARIQQVVWNLLSNAVKFTPRGGTVRVGVTRNGESVEIVVVDSGQGIAQAFLPHVFERFRQAAGGSTRTQGGLGLGLSIVRQLTELHGGSVKADSEGEGRGATFTVRLPLTTHSRHVDPLSRPVHRPVVPSGIHCPPEVRGLRLLVIDDEEDTRELLRTLLDQCGAIITVGASAAEGLAMCERERPDVILSDIAMPGQDGFDFIRLLRARESTAETPAIALTAYARPEDRTRALRAGFQSHVAKPVDADELLAVIASLAPARR